MAPCNFCLVCVCEKVHNWKGVARDGRSDEGRRRGGAAAPCRWRSKNSTRCVRFVCVYMCVCAAEFGDGNRARHPRRRRRRRRRLHRFRTKPINNAQTPGVHALVKNHEREKDKPTPSTHVLSLAQTHPRQTNAPFFANLCTARPAFLWIARSLPPELRHWRISLAAPLR